MFFDVFIFTLFNYHEITITCKSNPAINKFQGRKILLNLAQRMKLCFSSVVGSSISSCWNVLTPDSHDVRVMSRTNTEPGTPIGVILNGGTSLWLPVLPKRLFDFLGNQNSRSEVFYN